MARALVAAHLGHYGDHVIPEIPREWRLGVAHLNRCSCALPVSAGRDGRLSIRDRLQQTRLVDRHDRGIGGSPFRGVRPVSLMVPYGSLSLINCQSIPPKSLDYFAIIVDYWQILWAIAFVYTCYLAISLEIQRFSSRWVIWFVSCACKARSPIE